MGVFYSYRLDCNINGRLILVKIKIDLIGDSVGLSDQNFIKPLKPGSIMKYVLRGIEAAIYTLYVNQAFPNRDGCKTVRVNMPSCWQQLSYYKKPQGYRWFMRPCPYNIHCCVHEYFVELNHLGIPPYIIAVNEIDRGDPDSCMSNLCYYVRISLGVGDSIRYRSIILQNEGSKLVFRILYLIFKKK